MLALAVLLGVVVARDASAVGTRTFELDSLEELSGGDLAGVSVGSDGIVRAGWTLGKVPLPDDAGTTATCMVELPDGSVLVGTGPSAGGKVVRVLGDRATIFADTKESAVVSLAVDKKGTAFAATTSNKIYRIGQGKAEVFATLPDVESVLAIAFDPSGTALYAATGSDGRVLRVDATGASSTYFKTDAPFVVSLAVAADGAVYAGTSGKGLLYRITGPGRASVLDDFHAEDVHAIAVGSDQTVWAIVNEAASGPPSEPSESASSRHNAGGRSQPGPAASARSKPGKGSLWRFVAGGHPERLMHHDESHYTSLALDGRGVPYVGTGAEGRVYTVDDAHVVSLLADTDERQIGALGIAGRTRFAVGSDPAVFHRILSVGGPGGRVDEQDARRGAQRPLRPRDLERHGPARSIDAHRRHPEPRRDVEPLERARRQRSGDGEPARALRSIASALARRRLEHLGRDDRVRDREPPGDRDGGIRTPEERRRARLQRRDRAEWQRAVEARQRASRLVEDR